MIPPRALQRLCASVALVLWPAAARAVEYEVRAETVSQAYQIRTPYGAPILSARRLTQSLSFSLLHRTRDDGRGIVINARLRLRLDGEFGDACGGAAGRCLEESLRERATDFVPGFARRSADVPFAYVDVSGIAEGALDVRAGRVITTDVLGFFSFDGARTRLRITRYLTAELLGGLEVRSGFPLSSGRFERDGVTRLDRGAWDPSLAPWVQQRNSAPVVGAALESGEAIPGVARVAYRRVWTQSGLSEDRVGAALDTTIDRAVRVYADATYSLASRTLGSARAGVGWSAPSRRGGVSLGYERYAPVFDLDSIWASFWTDNTDELRAHGELRANDRFTLTADAYGRRYAHSQTGLSTNATRADDAWNGGGAVTLRGVFPSWRANARVLAEGGSAGARGGTDVDVAWWVIADRLRLDARASFWITHDVLRPAVGGPSFALVAGATAKLGSLAVLHFDAEDDINSYVGQRFRVMATLDFSANP